MADKEYAFVYVWGLRGPEGQIWDTSIERDAPKAITKKLILAGDDLKLSLTELVAKYPAPADATPPAPETDTKKPAEEPALPISPPQ